jgi:hypothetical protein
VAREVDERLGLSADGYVLALVGGTGVGKSSLLNATAGETVSTVSVRRPTTGRPVAWVAASAIEDVRPLLDRLDVGTVRIHGGHALGGVVVLDLPDVDSLAPEHRALVEAILPKVDAVAWVLDPEKYADALLHDRFLRTWVPRLDRQVVVLNKADRLDDRQLEVVRADLGDILARELGIGARTARPAVLATSAVRGPAGVEPFRSWLEAGVDAKAVVAARLDAAAQAAALALAEEAGVASEARPGPLLPPEARRRTIEAASEDALRVVDVRGAEEQAVAATRARARPRGAGPLGRVTAFVYRYSGREARVADPRRYLLAWRERGTLTRTAERVRAVIATTVPAVPAPLRARYATTAEAGLLERRFASAVDRALADLPGLEPPRSVVWSLLGLLQTVATVALVAAAAWIVAWILLRPPVDPVVVPVLGSVPAPLALLVVAVLAGYLLARALSLHAGWVGRRWARGVAARVRTMVADVVAAHAFETVDAIEAARLSLWSAWRGLRTGGGS